MKSGPKASCLAGETMPAAAASFAADLKQSWYNVT